VQSRIAFALAALSVLLHWPFGHADFVYDDVDFIRANQSVYSLPAALAATLAPFPPDQPERGLYRPLATLSHATDYAVFQDEPRGHHAVNAVLYGLLVLGVYALAREWFGAQSWTAVAATLVFAVHPVHCEAVDTISGRSELLALGFAIASLWVFLRSEDQVDSAPRRGRHLLSGLLYALACGSKESAVLLPAILVLHLLARDGAPTGALAFTRRAVQHTSVHIAVACLYLALRLEVLGGFGPAAPVLAGIDPLTRASTIGSVFAEYLRLMLWPGVLQLDFYYQYTLGVPSTPTLQSWIGWLAIAVLLGGTLLATAGALRGRATSLHSPRGAWIAGMGTGFVFLLPVSHLLGIGALMAERFLFAPSLGFVLFGCALSAHGMRRWIADPRARQWIAIGALTAIALAGGTRSALRASQWRDGVRLWESLARATPNDYRPYSNAATHWIARANYDAAEQSLRHALELEPRDAAVRTNLAVVLMERGDLDGAEAIHRGLLAEDPRDVHARFNLGVIALRRDEVSLALAHFEAALEVNPNFMPAADNATAARARIEAARRYLHLHRVRAREAHESRDREFLETYRRACRVAGDACSAANR